MRWEWAQSGGWHEVHGMGGGWESEFFDQEGRRRGTCARIVM